MLDEASKLLADEPAVALKSQEAVGIFVTHTTVLLRAGMFEKLSEVRQLNDSRCACEFHLLASKYKPTHKSNIPAHDTHVTTSIDILHTPHPSDELLASIAAPCLYSFIHSTAGLARCPAPLHRQVTHTPFIHTHTLHLAASRSSPPLSLPILFITTIPTP